MILNFHQSSAETSTGTSAVTALGNLAGWAIFVKTSAVSGVSPTLVVKFQHSPNNADWYDVAGLATSTISTVTSMQVSLSTENLLADYIRCVWTIGGTNPSFTFTVDLLCRGL